MFYVRHEHRPDRLNIISKSSQFLPTLTVINNDFVFIEIFFNKGVHCFTFLIEVLKLEIPCKENEQTQHRSTY